MVDLVDRLAHRGEDPGGEHVGIAEHLAGDAARQAIGKLFEPVLKTVDPKTLGKDETGSSIAVPIFRDFMMAALKAVPILARAAGLAAHLYEESQRPIGFILSNHADQAITYDGAKAGESAQ